MLVYFAVILTVLLGFCGLAVDTGRVELRTLQMQAAVDAGAVGAATELQRGTSSWMNAAYSDVFDFEWLNNLPMSSPVAQQSAASGLYGGDYSTVQVTLQQSVPTFFLGRLTSGASSSSIDLSVKAVAEMPPCGYFFGTPNNASSTAGMWLASAGFTTTCPIYSGSGVVVDGFSYIHYSQLKTAGPSGLTTMQGWAWPAPIYDAPVLADPLAWIAAPVFSACGHTGASYTTATTIYPGTYCGGLTVTNATVTMSPGLYIITGGVNFSGATINGTGVTMYLTQGGGSGFGTFYMHSSSTMNVSAPVDNSAGGIPGLVIFGDRAWSGGNEDFKFVGGTFKGDGILYTTNTGIYDWQCTMSGTNYLNLVTANLYDYNANVTLSSNYSTLSGGSPLHTVITLVQ